MSAGAAAQSPLQQIEAAVQQRAKQSSLDVASDGGRDRLRRLLVEEVELWQENFKRGAKSFELGDPDAVVDRAFRNLAGFGPLEPLLEDADVWEVMVNAPDAIFVRRHRGHSGYHHEVFHDDDHVMRILTRLLDSAGSSHRKLDPAEGLQDAQLENGARMHIVHRDIGRDDHVLVNIRKFTGVSYKTLAELVGMGAIDRRTAKFLAAAVRSRLSILFAGRPGAGKTTLLSCCAAELDPSLRVVVAEEVFETVIPLPNVAHLQTRPSRVDRPAVDLRKLVGGFLRMAPDVAIVGEVRDAEALPLLMTLSSGVTGYTTIHAASARQALLRLRFLSMLSGATKDVPFSALTSLVSESIDLVVYSERSDGRVVVSEIAAVEDPQSEGGGGGGGGVFTITPLLGNGAGGGGQLQWSGNVPVRASRKMASSGFDIRELLGGRDAPVSSVPGAGGR